MNILPITQNNCKVSFNARLFNKNGKQIKSFDLFNTSGIDKMSKRGSQSTDIFVKNIISEELYGTYQNSADYVIKNPLFGEQHFLQKLYHETNSPVETSDDVLHHLDILTSNTESLENKALRAALLDNTKYRVGDNYKAPSNVLEDMLKETSPEEHGFSEERINDFRQIADNLTSDIVKAGLKIVKK